MSFIGFVWNTCWMELLLHHHHHHHLCSEINGTRLLQKLNRNLILVSPLCSDSYILFFSNYLSSKIHITFTMWWHSWSLALTCVQQPQRATVWSGPRPRNGGGKQSNPKLSRCQRHSSRQIAIAVTYQHWISAGGTSGVGDFCALPRAKATGPHMGFLKFVSTAGSTSAPLSAGDWHWASACGKPIQQAVEVPYSTFATMALAVKAYHRH